MYNVKVIHYVGGDQMRIYKKPIKSPGETMRLNPDTGEIIPLQHDPDKIMYNPFTDRVEYVRDLVDADRSAHVSAARTVNKIYSITRSNRWEWFVTLTFDPVKVDSYDYGVVSKKLHQWIDNLKRRYCPDLKYILVPELHKSGRYHFHGLFAVCDGLKMVDSGHRVIKRYRDDKGRMRFKKTDQIIYNVGRYNYGWSTATQVTDTKRVSSYISKYITKDLCAATVNKKRYWASRNLDQAQEELYLFEQGHQYDMELLVREDVVHKQIKDSVYNTIVYLELSNDD